MTCNGTYGVSTLALRPLVGELELLGGRSQRYQVLPEGAFAWEDPAAADLAYREDPMGAGPAYQEDPA